MSDLTIADVIKMKVLDLRKELKSRGLPSTGDKAVLIERLQATLSNDTPDDHGDINLDSDDMTSEAAWILEDDEELLVDQPLPSTPIVKNYADEGNPETSLKRKIKDKKAKEPDSKTEENTSAKKIILNRATSTTSITASSVTSSPPVPTAEKTEEKDVKPDSSTNNDKIKIEPSGDKDRTQSRLELRAKRFGLPVKMTDDEKKRGT
uniref:SAP domain-containing protein n=1 Tax=Pectinophora gossypiella TaxID=13191 RepID=A0A1E1WMK6_PECGO